MELISCKKHEFDEIYTLMQQSFIPDELRSREAALAVMDDPAFTVYHLVENGARVGFITAWALDEFLFLEHFATYEKFRNQGLGKKALEAILALHPLAVLEAEVPQTPLQKRRIAFYERCGFVCNDIPYFQPAYSEKGAPVPLVLMSSGKALSDPHAAARAIYQKVYHKNYPLEESDEKA